jgi:hypothetical protein
VKGRKKKKKKKWWIHILHNVVFTIVSQVDEFMNNDNQYFLESDIRYLDLCLSQGHSAVEGNS